MNELAVMLYKIKHIPVFVLTTVPCTANYELCRNINEKINVTVKGKY